MIETREPEINIEALKTRIRQAVERREADGQTSFAKASAELFELLRKDDFSPESLLGDLPASDALVSSPTEFSLQPAFARAADHHYHVNDLLQYHDHQFVWNAYLALLKREPDEEGLRRHLNELRGGRINKIDILARLHYSPEGKRKNVTVDGLRVPAYLRRLYRVPIVGYVLELFVAIARLPYLLRSLRRIEGHLGAQDERITQHFSHELARNRAEFVEALNRLASEQKQLARIQHKQLTALFRQTTDHGLAKMSENGQPSSSNATTVDLDELYASFQDQLRGTREETRESLKVYLPLLEEEGIDSEILDLGCGRGEWLELLRDRGIAARGVESNRVLITAARRRDFDVVEADAVRHLRALPEESLKAVTAFHLVEHVSLEQLVDLLSEIRRTLKPGGLVILETPNPKNLVVSACNFYSDPTHQRPLFPESLEFILNHLGFKDTRIQYLHPVEDSPFDNGDDGARALHSWFFSPRDYAVTAKKVGRSRSH
jgi:SAM-dependent methyltransferase